MTRSCLLTSDGQGDIEDIWNAIGQHDLDAAAGVLRAIQERLRLISQHPHIGRERSDLFLGLRSFAVRGYLILYIATDDGVEVMRVLRGSRDISAALARGRDD